MPETQKIPLNSFNQLKLNKREYYQKQQFNYPDSNIPVDKKREEYYVQWASKIYHLCLNGKTWMPLVDYNSIDLMRAYSNGRQPTAQYRDWILGSWGMRSSGNNTNNDFAAGGWDVRNEETAEVRRKAWSNIDVQPVSVAPKIKAKVNEHIRSMYYEMSVKAIDSISVENEESAKWRLWFEHENREWLESQYALASVRMDEPVFVPINLYELELYASSGGFKVPYALAMEDLLKHTFEVSDWDKEVAEKVVDDLITIGYACVAEEFDRELQRVVVKYCDPKFSGVQYQRVNSFKNSEYGYTMEWVELSKIRQRLNLDYAQAAALAYSYSDQFGNPSQDDWGKYGDMTFRGNTITYGFDFYKVPIFNFEFIDIDNEQYIELTNKYGRVVTKRYNGQLQDNEKLKTSERRIVRQGKWIVGTQYIFDWGEKEYIPRDEYMKPRLSYRAVKLNTIPVIEQVKPFLDGFTLSWSKLQDFIAKAVGNGFAIDIGSLKDISIGKDKSFDPLEVLNYYRHSTFLLYKRSKAGLSGLQKVNAPPVIPINNNTYDNIRAQFESMNFFMQKVEDVTGLSMVALGKSADPNVAKFNMQVSVQGTNEIINNLARAKTDLQEDISINLCYRIRSLCRVNKFIADSYAEVIGQQRMKTVLDAEKSHVKYGIKIEASDITEEKNNVMAMLQASIKAPGSPEVGRLDVSEAMIIQDMILQGQNFRRIGLIIGYMMRKKEREARMVSQQNIMLQGEQIKQPEIIKAQVKQNEQQFELMKMERQFYYDYYLKHGMPPGLGMPQENIEQGNQQM